VDITAGSSPSRVRVYVDGLSCEQLHIPPLGYVELPFVRKNVHITIVNELNRGNMVILGAVLLVTVLYALTHAAVSVYSRVQDMATCRALGWPPGYIIREVVGDSLSYGALAAVVGVGASFLVTGWGSLYVPWVRMSLIAAMALMIYALGSALSAVGASRVSPMLAMASGEAGARTRYTATGSAAGRRARTGATVAGLAVGAAVGRWRRNLLAVLCLAVATALLVVFLLVTLRLQGVLCGSLLGEFLILQVGPRHILTSLLCLGIAAVAVAEVIGLNIAERRGEFAVLAALGWRPRTMRLMVAGEGAVLGLVGGLAGAVIAVLALSVYYGSDGSLLWLSALAVVPIPVCAGFLGALAPGLAVGSPHS